MSWIIVDTNQAIRAQPSFIDSLHAEGIIIPPFALGELWKSKDRRPIEKLAQYPLRLGMSPGGVMEKIASLRRSQIITFRPFLNRSSRETQRGLLNPSDDKIKKAVEKITKHIQAGTDFFRSARKGSHDRDFKFAGFSEALQELDTGPDSFLGSTVINSVTNGGKHSVRANPRALYTGAMQNPYLRHFFHTLLWYIVSFQQSWTKEHDEWNFSIDDNNWTDITLPLYTARGDIILAEDKKVRMAASAVNPDGAIKVRWDKRNGAE